MGTRRRSSIRVEAKGTTSSPSENIQDCVHRACSRKESPHANAIAFDPTDWEYDSTVPADITTEHDGVTRLACPVLEPCDDCGYRPHHSDTLVIAVDGACPRNGLHGCSVFGTGAYIGPGHPASRSGVWVTDHATSQKAEIQAGIDGLGAALDSGLLECLPSRGTLIVQTDSRYLCDGWTKWMPKWRANGWKTAAKTAVANRDYWEALDQAYRRVEEWGWDVYVWHIPREHNKQADHYAKQAIPDHSRSLPIREYMQEDDRGLWGFAFDLE